MARIKLSREAAMKAISYSDEAQKTLMANINVMDNNVNSHFTGLQDPTFKKYLELSGQMQEMLRQVSGKMNEISEYCQSVIRWIDDFSVV